ncbi:MULTISPECIES: protein-disulfide reductase DsbD domain-containing protein [unclassified Marinimicrobium]|jgi:hypothetical protein|uniref:protein-disulfide reductase DsbD domain-containing protein n=2 Tax=Cellvibrionaceae TaxID=1706371 RepID=UPI000C607A24|nr:MULTISPECIES: protein-disulfide reductase DsbD domain-containing protein [unclassified Marinimicrobium]MAN50308.1 hypothetical protein [Marinimicrobium sp.]MAN50340.1 hypothetical protein [Marinimicrobium sp.]|tara:strand:- start:154 stop:672 length:519 start_codon:yes stop_codon:yes gene_type:complete
MRMNKSQIFGWLVPGLGALAVVSALLAWQWPLLEPKTLDAAAGGEAAKTTADLVDILAVRGAGDSIRVTLLIEGDWHVNANPASLDFLIPTELSVSGGEPLPLEVDYPLGRTIDSGLGDEPWTIYDDGTIIRATLLKDVSNDQLTAEVRVQACHDSGRCLTPDTLQARLSLR